MVSFGLRMLKVRAPLAVPAALVGAASCGRGSTAWGACEACETCETCAACAVVASPKAHRAWSAFPECPVDAARAAVGQAKPWLLGTSCLLGGVSSAAVVSAPSKRLSGG